MPRIFDNIESRLAGSLTGHPENLTSRRFLCWLLQPAWLAAHRYTHGTLARRRNRPLPTIGRHA